MPRLNLRRLTALATASALALGTSATGWAAPPPIPPRVDPPARVGRLARTSGAVSFHTVDADQWSAAPLNYPVTSGDAFWTEPGAHADIQVASNRVAMDAATELDVVTLDDHTFAASEPQGSTYLNLRAVQSGNSYAVQTPRGLVQITATGRYEVVAGDASHPTTVTVVDGAANITGTNLSLQVGPRQTATITGTDTFQASAGPITQDAFLTAMLAEERPAPRASVTVPPVVAQMTGSEDLESQGNWQDTPQYGTVWYPPVETGWVPYRHGHWAYVAPWGWTWVDEAAWGFAPFHYGRWIDVNDRWGWVPVSPGVAGGYPQPVYAPALVSFVAIGAAGAAVGLAAGALAGQSVGWVPLGPREPYYPPYRANLAYVRGLNAASVPNVNQTITNVTVNNRTMVQNFINRGGATVVPAAAMLQSRPVAAAARPLAADQFARASAQFRAPLAPAAVTAGVTPAVARQFNFVPQARPAQPVAGPAIDPARLRAGPGGRPAPFALRPAAIAAPAAPGTTAPALTEPRPSEPRQEPGRPAEPPALAAPRPPELPRVEGPPGSAIHAAPPPAIHAEPAPGRPVVPAPEAARPQAALPAVHPQAARPPQPAFRPPVAAAPVERPAPPPRPAAPPPHPVAVAPRPAPAPPPAAPRPAAPPPRPAPPPHAEEPHRPEPGR
jgi:hypothetical protein